MLGAGTSAILATAIVASSVSGWGTVAMLSSETSAISRTVIVATSGGGLGAVAGTLGGYEARTRLVKAFNVPDFVIALLEDAVAVCGGILIVSRFQ